MRDVCALYLCGPARPRAPGLSETSHSLPTATCFHKPNPCAVIVRPPLWEELFPCDRLWWCKPAVRQATSLPAPRPDSCLRSLYENLIAGSGQRRWWQRIRRKMHCSVGIWYWTLCWASIYRDLFYLSVSGEEKVLNLTWRLLSRFYSGFCSVNNQIGPEKTL